MSARQPLSPILLCAVYLGGMSDWASATKHCAATAATIDSNCTELREEVGGTAQTCVNGSVEHKAVVASER